MIVRMLICLVVALCALNAYAQEPATNPFTGMDWKALAAMLTPILWAAVSPLVMKYVTMGINAAGGYVPRYIQIPMATVLGALVSAWTGDTTAIVNAAAAGGATQVYAGKDAKEMRTEPEPE